MTPETSAETEARSRWIAAVIRRPVSVSVASLTLVFLGLVSLWHLPLSLLPSLERPRLEVTVEAPERGRQELLEDVVRPLERRLASLPGVLDVVSILDEGAAWVTAETEWQTEVDRLHIDAERRLGDVLGGVEEATLSVGAGDARPIVRVAVLPASPGMDRAAATELAETVLFPELARLPGAGEVRLWGRVHRRPVVRPRAADLAARGLTPADVEARLLEVGRDETLGTVRRGGVLRSLVLRRPVESLTELADLRLDLPAGPQTADGETPNGHPIRLHEVRLHEVADVRLEAVDDGSVARIGGEEAVLLELHRAPEANAVRLARAAREVVSEVAGRQGAARLRLEIVDDASEEVMGALRALAEAALVGLVLGTLVLRFLLGRWRPTLALLLVVPASLISSFAAFHLAGVSLDLVSLAGLALAAGMLVDNSVVVVEAIATAGERGAARPVEEGTAQIAVALVAGFATTAVVFVPLIYLEGLARAFFGVQAFALVSALALSLVFSLTLTPVLSRRLRRGHDLQDADDRERSEAGDRPRDADHGRQPGRDLYLRLLGAALRRPLATLLLTLLVLAAVGALAPRLPRALVPTSAGHGVQAEVRLPAGLAAEEASRRLEQIERLEGPERADPPRTLSLYRERDAVESGGRARTGRRGSHSDGSAEVHWIAAGLGVAEVDARLDRPAGVTVELRPRRDAVSAAVERAGGHEELEVSASTPARARALAERVVRHLAARGVEVSVAGDRSVRPAWRVSPRPTPGPEAELAEPLRAGLGGRDLGRVGILGVEPSVRLEATAPADLGLLPVRAPRVDGASATAGPSVVPLAALADVEQTLRPPPDERRNGRPTVLLSVSPLLTVSPGTVFPEVADRLLSDLPLAADEKIVPGAETRELRRAFSQLRLALALALVLVFLAVAALYESLALPLAVMATVPTAAAGAVLALFVTGGGIDVMSFLGMILLAGLVVNNAIVLIHRVEQLRSSSREGPGLDLSAALPAAAAERYRPILITTLTTFLGMLPLALLGGAGVELRRSLATAVCGGLLTAWAGALLVVPVIYRLVRR